AGWLLFGHRLPPWAPVRSVRRARDRGQGVIVPAGRGSRIVGEPLRRGRPVDLGDLRLEVGGGRVDAWERGIESDAGLPRRRSLSRVLTLGGGRGREVSHGSLLGIAVEISSGRVEDGRVIAE